MARDPLYPLDSRRPTDVDAPRELDYRRDPFEADVPWSEDEGESIESQIRYYLGILYGRRWLILAAALVGLIYTGYRTFRQPRLFVAQSTVEFKPALPPGKDLDILQRQYYLPPELARRLLTTKILAARAIKMQRERGDLFFERAPSPAPQQPKRPEPSSLLTVATDGARGLIAGGVQWIRALLGGVSPPVDTAPSESERRDWDGVDVGLIGAYYGCISIRPVQMTSIVDIVATHTNPVVAAKLANDHAQAFVDMDVETKAASLSDAQGLFMRQIKEVRDQLEASRKALSDYQIEHGILAVPESETTITRQSAAQLNELFITASADRIAAEANYRYAAAMGATEVTANLPDQGLQSLRDEILRLRAQYAAQLQDYGPNHPEMERVQSQIESLSQQLEAAAGQARARLHATYEAALARENRLREQFEQVTKDATQEDREFVQLLVLQREVQSNEEIYSNLLGQAKEVDLVSASFQWGNVKQVDRAVPPLAPSFPQTKRELTMGLLMGLLAGCALAVFIERLDTSIHTPEEMDRVLRLPSLGVIPDFRRLGSAGHGYYGAYGRAGPRQENSDVPKDLVLLSNPASVISEAYRSLRTNLMFSSPGQPPKTVLITSSQAGEGKTVTSVNLAVSLALSGAKVLVIDADMRKPSCHGLLRVEQEPGLSNVLTGQTALEAAVVRSPVSPQIAHWGSEHGLFVLPAGRIPPNPAELVSSRVMTRLLSEVSERFDYVIIDSPPILPVSDSIAISTKTHAVILVVREGAWSRDIVRKAADQLRRVRAHTLGALLNCVHVRRGGSSYYYYQRYYGYGAKAPAYDDPEPEPSTDA